MSETARSTGSIGSDFYTPRDPLGSARDVFISPRSGRGSAQYGMSSGSDYDNYATPRQQDLHRCYQDDDDVFFGRPEEKKHQPHQRHMTPISESGAQHQHHHHQLVADADTAAAVVDDLFRAARHGKKSEVEKYLRLGIHVDTKDGFGNSLLTVACQNGNKKIAKLALRQGCSINQQNLKGNTALHYCYHFGYSALGEYLISKGADNTITNHYGHVCYDGISEEAKRR